MLPRFSKWSIFHQTLFAILLLNLSHCCVLVHPQFQNSTEQSQQAIYVDFLLVYSDQLLLIIIPLGVHCKSLQGVCKYGFNLSGKGSILPLKQMFSEVYRAHCSNCLNNQLLYTPEGFLLIWVEYNMNTHINNT